MIGEHMIRHLEQIGDLADADREALRGLRGTTADFQRGEEVLRKGERPDHVVVVLSGLLQRYTITPQGDRQIHSFYVASDAPCLETLHIEVMDNSLAATTPSRIGLVPHPELFALMDAHPKLGALFWRETLIQASVFREWLMRNSQLLAHARLAHFFCEMLVRSVAAGTASGLACELPITQEDLADALGMSTVHVNRTLTLLRAGRLLEFRDFRLTVNDWDQLAEIAEFDPGYLHFRTPPLCGVQRG